MSGPLPLLVMSLGAAFAAPEPVGGAGEAPDAEPIDTSVTNDFELRYYIRPERLPDPSDVPVFDYVEQVDRLNVNASRRGVAVEVQIDQVALFLNQYYLNDELKAERQLLSNQVYNPLPGFSYVNPEKVRVRLDAGKGTVVLGDAYAAFGRGIALNLNRNVDIDIDTSIQGVKAVLRPGAWDVTLVAGQLNRQQVFQDNPNIEIAPDLRHTVVGARAERFGLGPANVGAHGVVYDFVSEPGFGPAFSELGTTPDMFVGGATLELSGVGGIDWYAEGDIFADGGGLGPDAASSLDLAEDGRNPGYAGYLSAAFYPGKTVWLVEAKRYYGAERVNSLLTPELYEVAVAPTLEYERAITEDSGATVNSNDIWGARARMDLALGPGRSPYASVAVFRDEEIGPLHFNRSPETVIHGVVGLELIEEEHAALLNAGYRVDMREDAAHGADRQLHGDWTVNFPLLGGLHGNVQGGAEYYWWGNNAFQQEDYVEVETGWTVQHGSAVSFTWFTDFTSNPLIDSTGNLPSLSGGPGGGEVDVYGAGELQIKPSAAVTLKAFYGAYKAGIRCSGGQCRQLPGFEGARFSVVGSF